MKRYNFGEILVTLSFVAVTLIVALAIIDAAFDPWDVRCDFLGWSNYCGHK